MSWHEFYLHTGHSALSVFSIVVTRAQNKSQWPDPKGFQQLEKHHSVQDATSSGDVRETGFNVFKVIFIN